MFVALDVQHAMHMGHIFICGLSGCNYFSALSHKRYDFQKKKIEQEIRVLISSALLSETFLILRRNERDMIKNVYCS